MDRFGRWLWARHRTHYFGALLVAASAVLIGTVIGPSVFSIGVYFDLSLGETLIFAAAVIPASCVAVGLSAWISELRGPVTGWARGERSDPEAVWNAAIRAPSRVGLRGVVVAVPLLSPVVIGLLDRYVEVAAPAAVGLTAGTAAGVGMVALLSSALLQQLLRPLVEETLAVMPRAADLMPTGWNVRRRTVAATAIGSWGTGIIGGAAWKLDGSAEWGYLVVQISSVAVAAWITFTFTQVLFSPSFGPAQDLLDATLRIRLGDLVTPVPVTSGDEFGQLARGFNEMQQGLAEREALQAAFGSYVDPALAQRLLAQGSEIFEGEEVELTVLFADVRDFTSFSERVTPAEAVMLLNRLFDVLVPVLHEHGGHANHYLGDGLLAVFGAPQPLERHADAAVAAATDMQRRARAAFGADLRVGIGINSGPVIAGTVGGGGRHEFTVIGDTVNTAARVEQLTRETGDAILITEATRRALSTPRPRSLNRGAFTLKGKSSAVTVHAVNPFPRSTR